MTTVRLPRFYRDDAQISQIEQQLENVRTCDREGHKRSYRSMIPFLRSSEDQCRRCNATYSPNDPGEEAFADSNRPVHEKDYDF